MDSDEVKRKLRKLKRLECMLRNSGQLKNCPVSVWDSFFDLSGSEIKTKKARYDLFTLCAMSHDRLKTVIDEYWAYVYGELFQENLLQGRLFYDRDALIQLGLPFEADEAAVKKRFRELAKIYHPDVGGDSAKFIELMNLYRRLIVN